MGKVLTKMPETYKKNYKGKEIKEMLDKFEFGIHKM
jgi:hypothetical protein